MGLKDIFRLGREAQRKHTIAQRARRSAAVQRKPKNLAAYDPRQMIKGAGVLYEMVRPYFEKVYFEYLLPTMNVMRSDGGRIKGKFKKKETFTDSSKPDEEWQLLDEKV